MLFKIGFGALVDLDLRKFFLKKPMKCQFWLFFLEKRARLRFTVPTSNDKANHDVQDNNK